MPKYTEEQFTWRRIQQRFNKGVVQYGLIQDGDCILVGLSGGKDSLALLKLLAQRSRILKPRFRVVAVHVRMGSVAYSVDLNFLHRYARELGVDLYVMDSDFDASAQPEKSRCFLCSWHRRKALFELAKQLGCNKLALGHHMDDILETALMNLTFEGSFHSMPPLLRMQKFDLTIIRPMCMIPEADLQDYAASQQWPHPITRCPYDGHTNRTRIKQVLQQMQQLNPEARYSLWHSLQRTFGNATACEE